MDDRTGTAGHADPQRVQTPRRSGRRRKAKQIVGVKLIGDALQILLKASLGGELQYWPPESDASPDAEFVRRALISGMICGGSAKRGTCSV